MHVCRGAFRLLYPLPNSESQVNALKHYLKKFVDPTYGDFKRSPRSERLAFLACVAAYHAIDRAAYPRSAGNLRKKWAKECPQFVVVDMVAHHFKHVGSDFEKAPRKKDTIPLAGLVFGHGTYNTAAYNTVAYNQSGMELRNLSFVIGEVIKFLHKTAAELPE